MKPVVARDGRVAVRDMNEVGLNLNDPAFPDVRDAYHLIVEGCVRVGDEVGGRSRVLSERRADDRGRLTRGGEQVGRHQPAKPVTHEHPLGRASLADKHPVHHIRHVAARAEREVNVALTPRRHELRRVGDIELVVMLGPHPLLYPADLAPCHAEELVIVVVAHLDFDPVEPQRDNERDVVVGHVGYLYHAVVLIESDVLVAAHADIEVLVGIIPYNKTDAVLFPVFLESRILVPEPWNEALVLCRQVVRYVLLRLKGDAEAPYPTVLLDDSAARRD